MSDPSATLLLMATRRCKPCERDLPPEAFAKNQYACRDCQSARWKAYKEKHREYERERQRRYDRARSVEKASRQQASRQADPDKHRDMQLRSRYGISLAEQKALLIEQGGGCGICGTTQAPVMHQDHCHVSGLHRGVLCQPCNHVVGFFREEPQRMHAAVAYLHAATVEVAAPFAGRAAAALADFDGDLGAAYFSADVHLCPACQKRYPITHFVQGRQHRLGAQGRCASCRGRPVLPLDAALLRVTKYGLLAWQQMVLDVAFRNECAICMQPDPHRDVLHTDHCHESGLVRGLLCGRCNRGLGAARDDALTLVRAAEYLDHWSARNSPSLAS
jgi:hypothetical protein